MRKLLLISIALLFCGFIPLYEASATYYYPDTGDYGGGGVPAGVAAAGPNFGTSSSLRTVIMRILEGVFLLLGIITVIVIIIAGIYLMVGGGNDESRSKAVKMIMYAIIGLILILLAGAIVRFVATMF